MDNGTKPISIVIAYFKNELLKIMSDSGLPLAILNEIILGISLQLQSQSEIALKSDLKEYSEQKEIDRKE